MQFDLTHALEILERTPATFRALLGGLSEAWTAPNEGPETFSAFDNLGHVIHGERADWIARARIILEQGNRVVTKAELADHLQLEDFGPDRPRKVDTDRIIEVHIGNLRRKLGDNARSPKWLKTVRGVGYTLT